ncbi:hypothetical protein B0T24DRAFT_597941 [Lasiosphaeria ovina]|uniref:Uncharacterized protein n=1 Tax=Lasiosphaeria ovina TaxID=92902 RepID=A0AAE0N0I2_9PEZI|nr:hypothetical protein B0T24DRAFT_597941 [Lasiosphaeria ovina]
MASFCNYFRFASFMDDAARQHKFNLGSRSTDNGLSGFPIYGILGLMSDEFRTKIVVDYSPKEEDQFWHLYVHGCRIMIENGEYTILDLAASKERHSDLPTWCADFRYLSPTNYLGDGFDAGMARADSDNVEFCGLAMDRVKDVVQLPQDWVNRTLVNYSPSAAKQLLEREARCLQVSQQVYRTSPVEIPPQHIETLKTTTKWRKWFTIMAAGEEGQRPTVDADTDFAARRYSGGAIIAWEGSCFFSTGGGRIGIGSISMERGDSVHVFFNSHVPHVLQFDSTQQASAFVCPACVHDLMSGEAFWARDPINTYGRFIVR